MAGTFSFTIGAIHCLALSDGQSERDLSALHQRYPNATPEQAQDALAKLGADVVVNVGSMNILLIESAGKRILVDTGNGEGRNANYGHLLTNFRVADVKPEAIDLVFLTHFHGDHIWGLWTEENELVFPNARYLVNQAEWDASMNAAAWERMGIEQSTLLRNTLEPLQDKFTFVKGGDTIAEGVTVIEAFGHSLGHSGLLLESNGERLLHLVDLLHHPTQMVYPEWFILFDSDKEAAAKSRRDWLQWSADEQVLTMFYHLPFPGLGYVSAVDSSFRWRPFT